MRNGVDAIRRLVDLLEATQTVTLSIIDEPDDLLSD